jgi:hypothetical protein
MRDDFRHGLDRALLKPRNRHEQHEDVVVPNVQARVPGCRVYQPVGFGARAQFAQEVLVVGVSALAGELTFRVELHEVVAING